MKDDVSDIRDVSDKNHKQAACGKLEWGIGAIEIGDF